MTETPKTPKASPSTKRILVIDDDDSVREMLKVTLETEGFKVTTGRDGRNILQLTQRFEPDLIVTDMMMPGGGGYEVLRALQGDMSSRLTPVIVITGREWDQSTTDMLKQEPNVIAFLNKPIRPHSFLEKVHGVLNTKSRVEKMMEEQKNDINQLDKGRFGDLF